MFKEYKRTQVAEMRPVTTLDIEQYQMFGSIYVNIHSKDSDSEVVVSISSEDNRAGSPKIGDMIARNPKNHSDQWLVAKEYFKDNFEEKV